MARSQRDPAIGRLSSGAAGCAQAQPAFSARQLASNPPDMNSGRLQRPFIQLASMPSSASRSTSSSVSGGKRGWKLSA